MCRRSARSPRQRIRRQSGKQEQYSKEIRKKRETRKKPVKWPVSTRKSLLIFILIHPSIRRLCPWPWPPSRSRRIYSIVCSIRMCLSLSSEVGNCPNIHKIPGAGITIAQTLPEPQRYALHVPDQVIFQERTTLPHHNSRIKNLKLLVSA